MKTLPFLSISINAIVSFFGDCQVVLFSLILNNFPAICEMYFFPTSGFDYLPHWKKARRTLRVNTEKTVEMKAVPLDIDCPTL